MNISFKKANLSHIDIIFKWLNEPHIMEFWDNSQEHKDDILNFIQGRKQTYFAGTFQYWIGSVNSEPYSLILTDLIEVSECLEEPFKSNMSKTGHTIGLDFGIGNTKYLGQGLATPTLEAFVEFYNKKIDPLADTFFIDPDDNNPKAAHVYSKAGFQLVGNFIPSQGAFQGSNAKLMVKKIPTNSK
jgi:RimJ/RimL family protein N-acetyltransferase